MGKILGIRIHNFGCLKDVQLGRLSWDDEQAELGGMTAVIGASGSGKSTLLDAFGFIHDCLSSNVQEACDLRDRGGYRQLVSQDAREPMGFDLYYRESPDAHPITYSLSIACDDFGAPYVANERLRQRVRDKGQPLSFLTRDNGAGEAMPDADGVDVGQLTAERKVKVTLSDERQLGIVTLGNLKQYSTIERFLKFLKGWYLCYFSPDTARQIETTRPTPHLDRTGSNLSNVVEYMYK